MNAPSARACANSSGGIAFADRMTSSPEKPHALASVSSVAEEQSSPHPSSFRIRRIAGFGSAFTAKYSRNDGHQANALFSSRAFSRMPCSSYRWKGVGNCSAARMKTESGSEKFGMVVVLLRACGCPAAAAPADVY